MGFALILIRLCLHVLSSFQRTGNPLATAGPTRCQGRSSTDGSAVFRGTFQLYDRLFIVSTPQGKPEGRAVPEKRSLHLFGANLNSFSSDLEYEAIPGPGRPELDVGDLGAIDFHRALLNFARRIAR